MQGHVLPSFGVGGGQFCGSIKSLIVSEGSILYSVLPLELFDVRAVNQQILAAIKFGVSQNKVIWQLLNLASPRLYSVRSTSLAYVGSDKY